MKRLIFFSIVCMAFAATAFSQTTREEYNYVTKGYADDLTNGKGLKSGYSVETVKTEKIGDRTTLLNMFIRTSTKKIAAYMIIYTIEGYSPEYYCIPSPDSDDSIHELFLASIKPQATNAYAYQMRSITSIMTYGLTW